jgi:hypothetical protein
MHHRVGWVGFRVALSMDTRGSSRLKRELPHLDPARRS